MKLHTDHLAYLIQLEQGLKIEFFTALSATKKKLVLDLAEAKLVIVNDANQIIVAAHVNNLFHHVTDVFNNMAEVIPKLISKEEEDKRNGQTQQPQS